MHRRFALVLPLAFFITFTVDLIHAQGAATGTIAGRIVDPQGAVVPNATVVVRNLDTGIEQSTTSTAEGLYALPNLQPGDYDLRIVVPGFRIVEAKALHLRVGEKKDANFALLIAARKDEVSVVEALPLIETTKTDRSMVIDQNYVASLPLTNGFRGGLGSSNDYAALAASAPGIRFDFTGNSNDLIGPGSHNLRGNVYNIDGGNITDPLNTGRNALGATVDEVREIQVFTNNYNAEYGQAFGVILNVITKSGSNEFHGDGHAYFRGRNLSASDYFYNLGLVEAGCSTPPCQSVDGQRRAPFQKQEWGVTAGGPLIRNRTFWFGTFEKTYVAQPFTLTPATGALTLTQPIKEIIWSARIDHMLTPRNQLFVRFNQQRQLQDNLQYQVPSTASPESLVSSVTHDHTLNVSEVSTLTPHLVNEARFFWHRYFNMIGTKTTEPGQSGSSFYHGAPFCCPQGADQNRYQGGEDLTWTHGSHILKAGASISYFPYVSFFQQFHYGLYQAFTPAGLPTEFTISAGSGIVSSKDNIYGVYLQDAWKLRRNLNVNYGLRYDYEAGAFRGGSIPKPGGGCLQGNGIISVCSSDRNNFQPRVGIAYSPDGKTVVSAGFGEFTQMAFLNLSLDSLDFDGLTLLTATITDPSVLAYSPHTPPSSALAPFISARPATFGRVRPISDHLRNPEIRHVNLTITRQLGNTWVVSGGFVGVFGFGEFGERDLNFPVIAADPAHPGFFYFKPRPDPRFAAIRTVENTRTSHYDGLILHASKQLARHLQFQTNYTWSKTLTSAEDWYGTSEPGDPRNIAAEFGPAENDVRHFVNFSFLADSGRLTQERILRHLVNDWSFGWIGSIQSGRPYPVSTGTGPFAGSVFPGLGNGSETQQRPNVLPDGTIVVTNIASSDRGNILIGPGGAAYCACPQTTFLAPVGADPNGAKDTFTGDIVDFQYLNGVLGRNAARTSGYWRLDFSVKRAFRIKPQGDRMRLELRADFFNLFNHPNFLFFNSNDVLNLMPVSTDPNCRVCLNAFTGKFIGSDGYPLRIQDLQHGRTGSNWFNPRFGGLGMPTAADIPRQIQLSAKVVW